MSLHRFIFSTSIISDFGHIPVVHSHRPYLQCVCIISIYGWIAAKQLPPLSFSLCAFLCSSRDTSINRMPSLYLRSFLSIILCIRQNLSGCVWIQSVPVISAGQSAATEASPLTPLCWTLFCSDALHIISLCPLSNFLNSYLYHYILMSVGEGAHLCLNSALSNKGPT